MPDKFYTPEARKELLKHMILQLHKGEAPGEVRNRLIEILSSVPYDEVVEVEQQLISEGLPAEEVMKFCDLHTMVLEGHIDVSEAKSIPEGHPVDVFMKENEVLLKLAGDAEKLFLVANDIKAENLDEYLQKLKILFNQFSDVDKHYRRKEYLLFPYLEKYGITGPPTVMWGKHDEVRELLKSAHDVLGLEGRLEPEDIVSTINIILKPAVQAIVDMTVKEEQILFPMTMDKLTEDDWYNIQKQTPEIGFCLYDPKTDWKPSGTEIFHAASIESGDNQLSTGHLSTVELEAIFNSLPADITFVDKEDKVKYFSLSKDRIFDRNRSVLGRNVRMCHPPASVKVVEQILEDFKSGRENSASFWIRLKERFIFIEYFPLRDPEGNYLGTLEFTQDLTELRKLEGEQRLLSYGKIKKS